LKKNTSALELNSAILAALDDLKQDLSGELSLDKGLRMAYATDASIYRELPLGVVFPKHHDDLVKIVRCAHEHKIPLIPRAGGTSLAGQCVGSGLVIDTGRFMKDVLEINPEEKWVRVQPGVVRDELNELLKTYGLFFGPNTSTANRCMMGGMVGNNSSGSTSIRYGVTRDKVMSIKGVLASGESIEISPKTEQELGKLVAENSQEAFVYSSIIQLLIPAETRLKIRNAFPDPKLHRRNTGYAIDMLLHQKPFNEAGPDFSLAPLMAGSEGTLMLSSEITLQLDDLPPPCEVLIGAHFHSINESLRAAVMAMEHDLYSCELMDQVILDCTKGNKQQEENRYFVEGDPAALLVLELRGETKEESIEKAERLINILKEAGLGYAYPIILPPDTDKVWNLRKAGLGLLSNVPGEAKPVACIEDTAVALHKLPDYINEFDQLLEKFGQKAVYYAHAGAGELHLRPIINLKTSEGVRALRQICEASARLVAQYKGSLSGEHGDGRVRAEFIPLVLGDEMVRLFEKVKGIFDPNNILNPGKIVHAPPMDVSLRYETDREEPLVETFYHFEEKGGMLALAEKCNGSADCRKSTGLMCPSYQATKNEMLTTRARANTLREVMTHPTNPKTALDNEALKAVLDQCLSCKGCASECPSSVDVAVMKSEFLHQYYQNHKRPVRDILVKHYESMYRFLSPVAAPANALMKAPLFKNPIMTMLGIAAERQLPPVASSKHVGKWKKRGVPSDPDVVLFLDEFTQLHEPHIGEAAISVLEKLGYTTVLYVTKSSGRGAISKGFLEQARRYADRNIADLNKAHWNQLPVLGIEPSALLSFRDEYPKLCSPTLREDALALAQRTWMIEEFLEKEILAGRLEKRKFRPITLELSLHEHCHHKAIGKRGAAAFVLQWAGAHVKNIPSGCCGMAGSFGIEEKNFALSQAIGERVLFPAVRGAEGEICLNGTSCRHQVLEATGKQGKHFVELLEKAII
jgi:FAD/FMN-containing dehydrogenase/Fe-S oxidoreductase